MYLKVDHNRILESGNLKSLHYLQYFDLSHNKVGSTDFIYHGRLKQLKMNCKLGALQCLFSSFDRTLLPSGRLILSCR